MIDRRRRAAIALGAFGLAFVAVQHPTADLRIVTHDARDVSPRQFKAAFDVGLAGVSVLVTWTADRLR